MSKQNRRPLGRARQDVFATGAVTADETVPAPKLASVPMIPDPTPEPSKDAESEDTAAARDAEPGNARAVESAAASAVAEPEVEQTGGGEERTSPTPSTLAPATFTAPAAAPAAAPRSPAPPPQRSRARSSNKVTKSIDWEEDVEETFQDYIDWLWGGSKKRKQRIGRRRPSDNKVLSAIILTIRNHPELADEVIAAFPVDRRYKHNRQ